MKSDIFLIVSMMGLIATIYSTPPRLLEIYYLIILGVWLGINIVYMNLYKRETKWEHSQKHTKKLE